ncbi:hypothetical protein IE4771_CH04255 [Rhizobium etli bv. mimosae str. IE4771]|uniref:Uncharacterized protein n=1 Tax=Rhizobium etli bv. mimosae str. IE4771 TaxID=1432050 RepID=A0A060I296_RHIET|nr:hypothetical protein IE4771_CH04255 [Rhizobium sp. IE4771]
MSPRCCSRISLLRAVSADLDMKAVQKGKVGPARHRLSWSRFLHEIGGNIIGHRWIIEQKWCRRLYLP